MSSSADLDRENRILLSAVQALLRLISEEVIAVSVQVSSDSVVLHFWVVQHSAAVAEDIDDGLFELEALLFGSGLVVSTQVHLADPPSGWPGSMIYWKKF